MQNFSHHLNNESFFWFCALAGSGLFVIQFILTLVGGDHSDESDTGDGDSGTGDVKWISKQAIIGFMMIFGWVGLTCIKEFHLPGVFTVAISIGAGLIAFLVTGLIFKLANKLRSTGTVFRLEDAIGKEAVIYQRIPKGGMGKVTISLQDLTHEIDAISLTQDELPSFTEVEIIKTVNNNTLVVVPKKRPQVSSR